MQTLGIDRIQEALTSIDLLPEIEKGFRALSAGKAVVPPIGELSFEEPPGEVHIKYGYLRGDRYYLIKIASGFYQNPQRGLPSSRGMMLLFEQETGSLAAILLDGGYLTDVRTAVAGAIAAKYLAPARVHRIGILGTGTQARYQLEYLRQVTRCTDVVVWGRRQEALDRYRDDMERAGFRIETTTDAGRVGSTCNLIVTCTPAKEPILMLGHLRGGVHITAVGSDTVDKQELDPAILGRADVVVADSRAQCLERGEISHAVRAGILAESDLCELGEVIREGGGRRRSDEQVTVADLTGVAVQDIQIAKAVYEASIEVPVDTEQLPFI